MKIEGYKLNGYDATYDKATFDLRTRYKDDEKCVLEILDYNSGITFILELEKSLELFKRKRKKK